MLIPPINLRFTSRGLLCTYPQRWRWWAGWVSMGVEKETTSCRSVSPLPFHVFFGIFAWKKKGHEKQSLFCPLTIIRPSSLMIAYVTWGLAFFKKDRSIFTIHLICSSVSVIPRETILYARTHHLYGIVYVEAVFLHGGGPLPAPIRGTHDPAQCYSS